MKSIVLVGAGNAHLVFLRRWRMDPIPGAKITLVNESAVIPYSGALPAYVGGDFRREEIELDLVRLCATHGARFIHARAEKIAKPLVLRARPPLDYDVLSINVGSVAKSPPPGAIPLRPLSRLLDHLDALAPKHLVIVGGGASGCELAIALRRRFGCRVTLTNAGPRLIPNQAARVGRIFLDVLRARGIDVRLSTDEIPSGDAVLWAASPAPHPFARKVRDTLQSVNDPNIFAAGDCATLESYPHLPRNGVYSVREGRPLYDNIRAHVERRTLVPYRPQKHALSLLNSGDGRAVLAYGSLVSHSRWALAWKRRIDRQWLASFRPPPMKTAELMRCGGCGSKVPSETLSAALDRLDIPTHPNILIGVRDREDAAVFKPPSDSVEVQTVDFFKTFLDDPYRFGKIAAVHAASDLYAMNATPLAAQAIVTLSDTSVLHELLAGAVDAFREMGIVLAGGHTAEGMELALGFSVTGYAKTLFRKNALRPGDSLVLTKPLGSGGILAAHMRGECPAPVLDALLTSLERPNAAAARIAADLGVTACTDVTGFGLAGHLLEMLRASNVSADLAALPTYEGWNPRIVSTLHPENAKFAAHVDGTPDPIIFDPQTSGGLLFGISPDHAPAAVETLRAAGYSAAAIIGSVVPQKATGAPRLGSPRLNN